VANATIHATGKGVLTYTAVALFDIVRLGAAPTVNDRFDDLPGLGGNARELSGFGLGWGSLPYVE